MGVEENVSTVVDVGRSKCQCDVLPRDRASSHGLSQLWEARL